MSEQGYSRRKWANRVMLGLCTIGAAVAIAMLALILGYIVIHGVSYLNLDLFTQASKPAGEIGGGIRNELIGSLILVVVASAIALPIGLLTGMFLSDFGKPAVAAGVRFAADVLAGVPSIVVGVFVYAMVVRPMQSYSALAGGIALAIIMIPVVARTAEEALRLVPNSMREAALALGIARWRAMLGVVVPGAITGIVTGVMLALARIAGETAPLLFTALGNNFGFQSLLKPIAGLPLLIYSYAISPYQDQHEKAWAAAFILAVLVLVISIVVRLISRRNQA
jgi:phosphate transport system permease protein